jgi:hypothetical protein
MAVMFDIILSLLIGGLLLLSIINASSVINQNALIINGEMAVQQSLVSTAQLVEGEFRNMGFNVREDSATTITAATDTSISFKCDVDRDGIVDVVSYWQGATSELSKTQNELDRFLHRRVNNGPIQSIGVVTKFNLRYFSQRELDTLIPPILPADLSAIKIIEITMEVQSQFGYYKDPKDLKANERKALYPSSFWRQTRLASQNLKR